MPCSDVERSSRLKCVREFTFSAPRAPCHMAKPRTGSYGSSKPFKLWRHPVFRPLPLLQAPLSSTRMLICVLLLALGGPATADSRSGESSKHGTRSFTITHGPVVTQLTTPGSTGHQLGDLRVLTATPIFNRSMVEIGRLDAQLITTSIDYPAQGDEVRMTTLNFVFGAATGHLAGSADQIIVSGSGYYPSTLSTIAAGLKLIRPITGGSGRYAGAGGWAETEHLGDDSWRHTFYILRTDRR